MPIRSWMSSTMEQIEAEHPMLFALEFEKKKKKMLHLTLFTL